MKKAPWKSLKPVTSHCCWASLYYANYQPALWACLSKTWHLLVFVLYFRCIYTRQKAQLCVQLKTSTRNIPGMIMTAQHCLSLSAQMPTSILESEKEECENAAAKCPPHKKMNLGLYGDAESQVIQSHFSVFHQENVFQTAAANLRRSGLPGTCPAVF